VAPLTSPPGSHRQISVRRAVLGDETTVRGLRLEAMADAPEAFGSTYQRELARTSADWQGWLSPMATFLATESDEPKGLVVGAHDAHDPSVAHLLAMWVQPSLRGHGAADALVAAVLAWAAAEGVVAVRLKVVRGNASAERCYARNAFRPTGRETVRERDGLVEVEMERSVGLKV
jgi:GNAT superfamily N-acetyltransferase